MRISQLALKEISVHITKGTTPTTMGRPFVEEGINFIKAEALNGDTSLERSGFVFIDEETHQLLQRSILKENDVLVTIAGANTGKCGFVREADLPANTNQAVGIVRINHESAEPRFVYYFFKQKRTFDYIQTLSAQAAQPNLNLTNLGKTRVSLPPRNIQTRIASILSSYDDLIENNRRRIQLLEQSARMLYKEWFVHLRFPGHEHTKVINGVPKGWERKTLGDVVDVTKGKNITKDSAKDGFVPVVAGGLSPAYYHDNANAVGPVITVSTSGANAGYVNLYHEDIWASDCSYISRASTELLYYFYLLLSSKQKVIFGLQKGAAQPHVYPKDLKRLPLFDPPETLTKLFEEAVLHNFLQVKGLFGENKLLKRARDLLLPRLMNGEITI